MVSHERELLISDGKIEMFPGNYEEYLENIKDRSEAKARKDNIIVLKHRLSEILGKLSMPSPDDDVEKLDQEYKSILAESRDRGTD